MFYNFYNIIYKNNVNYLSNIKNNFQHNKLLTCLIIEPRDIDYIEFLIIDYNNKLKSNTLFIFYCGKGLKEKWTNIFSKYDIYLIIYELETNNLLLTEYSDILKNM